MNGHRFPSESVVLELQKKIINCGFNEKNSLNILSPISRLFPNKCKWCVQMANNHDESHWCSTLIVLIHRIRFYISHSWSENNFWRIVKTVDTPQPYSDNLLSSLLVEIFCRCNHHQACLKYVAMNLVLAEHPSWSVMVFLCFEFVISVEEITDLFSSKTFILMKFEKKKLPNVHEIFVANWNSQSIHFSIDYPQLLLCWIYKQRRRLPKYKCHIFPIYN